MNPFHNEQLVVEDLPQADILDFQALQPAYRTSQLIWNSIFWFILVTAISTTFFLNSTEIPNPVFFIAPSIGLFFLIISYLSIVFGFKNKAFAVRSHDINYKSGWLWKSKMVVPFKRIQHSEVTQGPVDRLFGLAKLRVFTAGGSGSDMTIPGLRFEEANRLKSLITSKITKKEVVQYEEE